MGTQEGGDSRGGLLLEGEQQNNWPPPPRAELIATIINKCTPPPPTTPLACSWTLLRSRQLLTIKRRRSRSRSHSPGFSWSIWIDYNLIDYWQSIVNEQYIGAHGQINSTNKRHICGGAQRRVDDEFGSKFKGHHHWHFCTIIWRCQRWRQACNGRMYEIDDRCYW